VNVTKSCETRLRFSSKHVQQKWKKLQRFSVASLVRFMSRMAPPSPHASAAVGNQRQIDAIELLLQDLGSVDPQLQHRASFQSCWRELSQLRGELVSLLLSRKRLMRDATAQSAPHSRAGD
jgi:hypothetical protein